MCPRGEDPFPFFPFFFPFALCVCVYVYVCMCVCVYVCVCVLAGSSSLHAGLPFVLRTPERAMNVHEESAP